MDTENEESNESWLVVPNKIDENVKSDEGSNGIQKKDAIINAAEASELSFEKSKLFLKFIFYFIIF